MIGEGTTTDFSALMLASIDLDFWFLLLLLQASHPMKQVVGIFFLVCTPKEGKKNEWLVSVSTVVRQWPGRLPKITATQDC